MFSIGEALWNSKVRGSNNTIYGPDSRNLDGSSVKHREKSLVNLTSVSLVMTSKWSLVVTGDSYNSLASQYATSAAKLILQRTTLSRTFSRSKYN